MVCDQEFISRSVHTGSQVSACIAVMICATLVNTQTHKQNRHRQLLTGYTISSASWVKNWVHQSENISIQCPHRRNSTMAMNGVNHRKKSFPPWLECVYKQLLLHITDCRLFNAVGTWNGKPSGLIHVCILGIWMHWVNAELNWRWLCYNKDVPSIVRTRLFMQQWSNCAIRLQIQTGTCRLCGSRSAVGHISKQLIGCYCCCRMH